MESFNKAMQDAQAELARIEERRERLLQLIEDLKALSGDELAELAPPPGYEPEGITAEIRKILSLTTVHLSAMQIRDSLVQRGFTKANPKTLLISVHTVLGRIEKELDVAERDGKPVYRAKRSGGIMESLLALQQALAASDAHFNPHIAELAKAAAEMQNPFAAMVKAAVETQKPLAHPFKPGTVTEVKKK